MIGATKDDLVGAFPLNGGGTPTTIAVAGAGKIYCFAISPNQTLLTGAENGLYQLDMLRNSWSIYSPLATFRQVVSLLTSNSNFYVAANGSAYYGSFSDSSLTPITGISNGSVISLGFGNFLCVLTTGGFGFLKNTWQPISGLDLSDYPYIVGGLVFLRNNPDTGKSWRAGTLVTQSNWKSYAIMARVMKRLNALEINGQNYPDILMVRYAHENIGGLAESSLIPYWVIYYQKGIGPVMFEKIRTVGGIENVVEREWVKSP